MKVLIGQPGMMRDPIGIITTTAPFVLTIINMLAISPVRLMRSKGAKGPEKIRGGAQSNNVKDNYGREQWM